VDTDHKALLDEISDEMHNRFPNQGARLEQLDAHLATVAMVIDHLRDEEVRHGADPVAHQKAMGTFVREW
jgi:hypothetical protein